MAPNPEYYQIIQLTKKDVLLFSDLVNVFNEVFEEQNAEIPSASYLEKLLDESGFMALVVLHNSKVVGGLTGYELQQYQQESTELLIYDIAVLPAFQRKGLGKRLMAKVEGICDAKDIPGRFVGAHREDTHALKFYESLGGKPEDVVHFSFSKN